MSAKKTINQITRALSRASKQIAAPWDEQRSDEYLRALTGLPESLVIRAIEQYADETTIHCMPLPGYIKERVRELQATEREHKADEIQSRDDLRLQWETRSPLQRVRDATSKWIAHVAMLQNFVLPLLDPVCDETVRQAEREGVRLGPLEIREIAGEILEGFREEYRRKGLDPVRGIAPAGNVHEAVRKTLVCERGGTAVAR